MFPSDRSKLVVQLPNLSLQIFAKARFFRDAFCPTSRLADSILSFVLNFSLVVFAFQLILFELILVFFANRIQFFDLKTKCEWKRNVNQWELIKTVWDYPTLSCNPVNSDWSKTFFSVSLWVKVKSSISFSWYLFMSSSKSLFDCLMASDSSWWPDIRSLSLNKQKNNYV